MDGLNQVFLRLLRDADGRVKCPGQNRASGPSLWSHRQNPSHWSAPPPHVQEGSTHIDCYMDYVIYTVQGGPKQQQRDFVYH